MPTPEVIIDFEPDWSSPPEIVYGFQSVVQSTPRFVEQRRPLLPSPVRGMKCTYTLESEEAQRLVNLLSYGSSKFLGVPIYSEPLLSAAITQGDSIITTTEDVSYLWNIQNCSYIMILDFVSHASEVLSLVSASGTVLLLSESISGSYTAENCVIYPVFVGVVKSFDKQPVTDLLFSISAEFEETSTEHAEASGSWSGLVERVCPEDLVAGSTSPSSSVSPSPWVCPDFAPLTIAAFTEYDPDLVLTAVGSDVTIDCSPGGSHYAYLQKSTGLSHVLPWYRFKLEVRRLPYDYGGTIANVWFYSTGKSAIGMRISVNSALGLVVLHGEGPYHGFDGDYYIYSSNFDLWIQVRIDPGWIYIDFYSDSGFTTLLGTARSANTGWTDPITVTGMAPIMTNASYTAYTAYLEGLIMSIRDFSVCEE